MFCAVLKDVNQLSIYGSIRYINYSLTKDLSGFRMNLYKVLMFRT